MKKMLLFIIMLISFIGIIQAQDSNHLEPKKTSFGIKLGISDNYFSSNNYPNELNFYAGFFIETKLSNNFSFQTEAVYSRALGLSFIEIPVLIKYSFNKKLSIYGGLEFNYMPDDRNVLSLEPNPFGQSLVFGTQYNISDKWFIDGRFNYGLTKQIDFSPIYGMTETAKRSSLRIGLGYKF